MSSSTPKIRVRIAPSPTGNLHVGTARAALFNELFARSHQGNFIIRIEDTDKARSKPEFEATILEGLAWLGLTWDEGPDRGGEYGPYRQSERTVLYQAAIAQLLENGSAYQDEMSGVIKLRVKPQAVTFTDAIRGQLSIHSDSWGGDFIIARARREVLYHLAVVVDDAAQKITHVIRGEDHLTNTARHILLQRALGYAHPVYAHVPLLVDEHRRKLSKRAGEVGLLAYRDVGYLPEAMLNYLALLGWSPKNDKEFFTHEELGRIFHLADIQKSPAFFSLAKLNDMNKHYLRQLSPEKLLDRATPFLHQQGIETDDRTYWQAALQCEQARVTTLSELASAVRFFSRSWSTDYAAPLLVWKKGTPADTQTRLRSLEHVLAQLDATAFTSETLHTKLITWIDTEKLGRGDTLWPLRVALTGQEHSPGPFEVAAVLGKDETLRRLHRALEKITTTSPSTSHPHSN